LQSAYILTTTLLQAEHHRVVDRSRQATQVSNRYIRFMKVGRDL